MLDLNAICEIARAGGAEIGEQVVFDAKAARTSPVPAGLHPVVQHRINLEHPSGLYAHQAIAIRKALDRRSICVATPTASGKTLIFTSVAVSMLLEHSGSVLLALYPAKALLHDQLGKWESAVKDCGLTIGIIDGGVDTSLRAQILSSCRIVLMTPDVMHAWLMARLNEPAIQRFVGALKLVVLDEAHIYDGVFGTNMAYLLRRLQAVSGVGQFLASSATIGDPVGFLKQLTGQTFDLIGSAEDGAAAAEKALIVCRAPIRRVTLLLRALIKECSNGTHGRFLVFADSRKRVEELAADGFRTTTDTDHSAETEDDLVPEHELDDIEDVVATIAKQRVLPYRAGYEEDDRDAIQRALTSGTLLGVVTTSALELGVDIGDIELVVLLGTPPSVKSFWQRAGRAGRHGKGLVVMLDLDGRVTAMGLQRYLAREPEPNWLYLDNEYLQYANALCAAEEEMQAPAALYSRTPFNTLPTSFVDLIENELRPTRPIPNDLYPLKQQAIGGPHRAFPVRNGVEKNYQVSCRQLPGQRLGTLSYSQLLREAFPGAVYRYLARPYRVFQLKHGSGEVICSRTRGFVRTSPLVQTAVFPRFSEQAYYLRKSSDAFIAECRLQVSERVVGFVEQYGQSKNEILYGVGNNYSQKPLARYIDTTGVCFYFPDEALQREKLGKYIALAFCRVCSIQDRDVGWGTFIAQTSPLGSASVRGFAVYDSAFGSLRLTRQIPSNLEDILREASRIATEEDAPNVAASADLMRRCLTSLGEPQENAMAADILGGTIHEEWKTVVAPDQVAICHDGQSHINEEVTVLRYIYTPQGIRYTLRAAKEGVQWQVSATMIRPINGVTLLEEYNVNTGETRPVST